MSQSASTFSVRRRRIAPVPTRIEPMLATLGSRVPSDADRYSFEFKWDGVRAITYNDGSRFSVRSRNQIEISQRYPELQLLHDALDGRRVTLDGEIVALDEVDRPSFTRLQQRMHVNLPTPALMRAVPILYVIFDLLYLDGESLVDKPFAQRREMLEELTLMGTSWQVSPAHVGEGEAMLATAQENRLEGIVAKKLDSVYLPGRRTSDWLKIKIVQRQEFVIGGWTDEKGGPGRLGALLVGYYECGAKSPATQMRYAGRVGSGFTGETHALMMKVLRQLESDESPFSERIRRKNTHFVKPQLVAEIEYRRWPNGGLIQQAAFKGLRTDKRSRDVVKEDPDCLS